MNIHSPTKTNEKHANNTKQWLSFSTVVRIHYEYVVNIAKHIKFYYQVFYIIAHNGNRVSIIHLIFHSKFSNAQTVMLISNYAEYL